MLCGFEILEHQPIPEELDGRRPMDLLTVHTKKFKQHLPDHQQQSTKAETEVKTTISFGELCCKYSNFVTCLMQCVHSEEISLPLMTKGCVFVTKDVSKIENHHKRFLCY